ncbi:MAG: hypothetical protein AAF434_04410 [Pseudomonadota bacterium]
MFQMIRNFATALTAILVLSACVGNHEMPATMSEDEKFAVEQLQWLDKADPVKDAAAAVASGKRELLSTGVRGGVLPGVDPEKSADYAETCGYTLVAGGTDVIRGDTHRAYLKRASEYAKAYNREMINHCSLD